jgi:hypothetical protein
MKVYWNQSTHYLLRPISIGIYQLSKYYDIILAHSWKLSWYMFACYRLPEEAALGHFSMLADMDMEYKPKQI